MIRTIAATIYRYSELQGHVVNQLAAYVKALYRINLRDNTYMKWDSKYGNGSCNEGYLKIDYKKQIHPWIV